MKSKIGLWIGHRKAHIVTIAEKGEETTQITSHMENHGRYSDGLRRLRLVLWNAL